MATATKMATPSTPGTGRISTSSCSRKLSKAGIHSRHVAVAYEDGQPELYVLDQDADICRKFQISPPEDYALKFNKPQKPVFITEENRHDIQDAFILTLTLRTEKMSQKISRCLQSSDARERSVALNQLLDLAADVTFSQVFVSSQNGLHLLMCIAVIGESSCVAESLTTILRCIILLVNNTDQSWDRIEHRFLKMLMNTVKSKTTSAATGVLEAILDTLLAVITHSEEHYETVEQAVKLEALVEHLKNSSPVVQAKVLAVINALLTEADRTKKQKMITYLQSKEVRITLMLNVLSYRLPAEIDPDVAHQLSRLQSAIFVTELSDRRVMAPSVEDKTLTARVRALKMIAFGKDSRLPPEMASQMSLSEYEYKQIGFQDLQNPLMDFQCVPPGRLALDNVIHFANVYKEGYAKIILESANREDEYAFPFIQASINLTDLLFHLLKFDHPEEERTEEFQPLFLGQPSPFEELFSECIQVFSKTWKEMSSTMDDYDRVLDVLEEQVSGALASHPYNFLALRAKLEEMSYTAISHLRHTRRQSVEVVTNHLRPILELKAKLTPVILELIKEQRLKHLVKGSMFEKHIKGNRAKDKYMFGRISANHKVFHYDDWNDINPPCHIEELRKQVIIEDIHCIERSCFKDKDKNKKQMGHSFSVTVRNGDGEETLTFTPIGPTAIDTWMDGFNLLLGKEMCSALALDELDSLLNMELRVRLLDLDDVSIPQQPPEMPEPPPTYEFVYE